ncbi:hypothetical protein N7535_000631 [Penicillium sp. DV-2018c]|nr:hypothetical protein N7535_000631 [Penicillium sp. DV-2018c]
MRQQFHMEDDPGFADDGRDLCRYRCESQAYQALHAHGVCRQGIVPYFYGLFETFDPELLGDNLESFKEDKNFPCAILLEYLPNATSFESAGVSPELVKIAFEGLKKIHGARVIHNDTYPKNVLVVPRPEPHRVIWVDFDVSIVFSPEEETRGKLNLDDEAAVEMELFECRARRLALSGDLAAREALLVARSYEKGVANWRRWGKSEALDEEIEGEHGVIDVFTRT